jgi:prepilin-type N-terminal cleavage/methylation domain-containing protein
MQIPTRSERRAFTLMEVLLASAIALVILSGIYVAIDTQVRIAEQGRNLIDRATLARSLTARVTADVAPCGGMPDPSRYRSSSSSPSSSSNPSSGGSGGSGSGRTTTTTTTTTTTQNSSSNSSSSPSSGSSSNSSGTTTTTQTDSLRAFYGQETYLRAFVARVPRSIALSTTAGGASTAGTTAVESDQKMVIYWLAGAGSNQPLGLARYEIPLTTSVDGVPDVVGSSDEGKYVIAPEVVSLLFEYYDATTSTWSTSWDATQLSSQDNMTPIGPPQAIRMTFELLPPPGETKNLKFEQVIAIPTANGATTVTSDPSQVQDN